MPLELVTITRENLEEYRAFLPKDVAEHIGRSYFHALAVHGNGELPDGAAVWNTDRSGRQAVLSWFSSADTGSAQALLEELERQWMEIGVESCVLEFEAMEQKLQTVFEHAGFVLQTVESRDLQLTVADLKALLASAQPKASPGIVTVGELTVNQLRKGIANCLFCHKEGILADLATLPLSWFEPDLSCCVRIEGKVCGFLLVHSMCTGRLDVELLFAAEPAGKQDLIAMIRYAIWQTAEHYPPETQVLIHRCSDATRALTDRMFPGRMGTEVIFGEKILAEMNTEQKGMDQT